MTQTGTYEGASLSHSEGLVVYESGMPINQKSIWPELPSLFGTMTERESTIQPMSGQQDPLLNCGVQLIGLLQNHYPTGQVTGDIFI